MGAGTGAGGVGIGVGVGFELGLGIGVEGRPWTTSRSNIFNESGFAGAGMLFSPDPPVLLRRQDCCPGHSFTFLQPQAFKYHLCTPSAPDLTPQSTLFQPARAFAAVELVDDVTAFQSPLSALPQTLPYSPSRILAVSDASKLYCSKKLEA